jgi:hypothetical protein
MSTQRKSIAILRSTTVLLLLAAIALRLFALGISPSPSALKYCIDYSVPFDEREWMNEARDGEEVDPFSEFPAFLAHASVWSNAPFTGKNFLPRTGTIDRTRIYLHNLTLRI